MNRKQQKSRKFVHQATQIVSEIKRFYDSKESIYLTVLIAVMLFMPFAHLLYYGDSDIKGDFFGFTWMSSFLFALALPSFMCSTGLMLRLISRKHDILLFNRLSYVVMFSGSFYFVWTFWTTPNDFKDISLGWYLTVLIILSIAFFVLLRLVDKYVSRSEEALKTTIKKLTHAIQLLVRFITKQRFKAKDLRDYEKDYKEILIEVDKVTD